MYCISTRNRKRERGAELDVQLLKNLRVKKSEKKRMPNKELAAQHKAKGNAALAAKDFEKAIAEYTQVSGANPKNTRLEIYLF